MHIVQLLESLHDMSACIAGKTELVHGINVGPIMAEPLSKDQSMGADEDDMLCVFDKQLRDDIVLANCCSINFMLCMQLRAMKGTGGAIKV